MKDLVRKIALKLLLEFEEHHTFLNLALKNGLRCLKDERDRRFASALVYGVVERKITLDYFIGKLTEKRLDPTVRMILRMGILQMFYMQVPASAACDTSVELAKQVGRSYSAGLINALLRRCAEEKDQLLLLKKVDFSVRYSISTEIVDLLLEQYRKEVFVAIMEQGCGKDEAVYLCRNAKKCSDKEFCDLMRGEGVAVEETEIPLIYRSATPFSVEDSPSFAAGCFHIIGFHSAMAAALLPESAKDILDLCAAPGGKTFMMASLSDGSIKAFDLYRHKAELLKKGAERLGHSNVVSEQMDSSIFKKELKASADFVLCDVPCSGLGMMGKKPEIKYKDCDNASLCAIQQKILCNGAEYLKENGRLVYSTCTIDRRENEQQIQAFLKAHPEFSIDTENAIYGEQLFLPGENGDGFYIAVLKKGKQIESRS